MVRREAGLDALAHFHFFFSKSVQHDKLCSVRKEDDEMLKQIILYFFSHGIPGVITFLSVAVYSRMMLPEEYGVFALAMTVVSFLNSVMFQWLRLGFLRFFPRDIEAGQMSRSLSTVAAAFMIVVVLTASLSSIGYIVMGSTAGIAGLWLMSMLIGWAQAWFELQLTFFRSQMQGIKYGILSLIRAVLVFLLSLLAIGYGLGAYGLLGGLFTGLLLSAAIPTVTIWTKHIRIRHVDLKLLRELLHYGLPLTLTFALSTIIHITDRIVIGKVLGLEEAGAYAMSFDFTENSLTTIFMIINLGALPIVIKTMERHGQKEASLSIGANIGWLFGIGLPAAVGLSVLAPSLVNTMFGEEYRAIAVSIIPIVAFTGFIRCMKMYGVDVIFQTMKSTRKQLLPTGLAAVSNLLLNLWLVPIFGIYGSLIGTSVAYALGIGYGWIIAYQLLPVKLPLKDMGKATLAAGLMALLIWPLRTYTGVGFVVLSVIVGVVIFVISSWIMDLFELRQMTKRYWHKGKVKERVNG